MEYETMKTLYDLMLAEAFEGKNITSDEDLLFKKIITDDDEALNYIGTLSLNFKDDVHDANILDFGVAKDRAIHSAIAYLTGRIFWEFNHFKTKITETLDEFGAKYTNGSELWTMTSLNHDRGYFSVYIGREDTDPNKFKRERYALQDLFCDLKDDEDERIANFSNVFPKVFAYTYETLLAYEKYAIRFHASENRRDWDPEKYDHGLLGAAITYNKFRKDAEAEYALNADKEKLEIRHILAKTVALTIAQHNVFRSNSPEGDQVYGPDLKQLHSTNHYKIGMDTPLLMFLDLVDTLEFVKRFSKRERNIDKPKSTNTYFYKDRLMKLIKIEVSETEIIIDLQDFYQEVQKKIEKERRYLQLGKKKSTPMQDKYNFYTSGILNLSSWTWFEGDKPDKNEEVYVIRMNKDPYN